MLEKCHENSVFKGVANCLILHLWVEFLELAYYNDESSSLSQTSLNLRKCANFVAVNWTVLSFIITILLADT